MSVNRTRQYFDTATNYRVDLRKIWEDYNNTTANLEPYKGSAGYDTDMENAVKKRDEAISKIQADYRNKFGTIIKGMKESATSQPVKAPTSEQLSILQTLKMRNKVSRDELTQVAKTFENCPLCLSVLNEIAEANEYLGLRFGKESTAEIMQHIDTLNESANRICSLHKPDSKREQAKRASIYNPEHTSDAVYSFFVDKDVSSVAEAMSVFGGVNDIDSFRDVVD